MIYVTMTFLFLTFGAFASSVHFVESCRVFDKAGMELLSLPGQRCLFLDDGSFISSNEKGIKFFDKNKSLRWSFEGHFHHQLNFTSDKKYILAMGSEVMMFGKHKSRVDIFWKIDLNGKVVLKLSSDEIFRQLKTPVEHNLMDSQMMFEVGAPIEISHFNSFYEVPSLNSAYSKKFLKGGEFIVNSLLHGGFILSSDLSRVIQKIPITASFQNNMHDMQVLPNGNILVYNNYESATDFLTPSSAIQEFDIENGSVLFSIRATPKAFFHSPFRGGVQKITDDLYLFSHLSNGIFIYSKIKKDMIYSSRKLHLLGGRPIYVQQVYARDLTQFLKAWNLPPGRPYRF